MDDVSVTAVIGRAPGRVNLIGEHTDYNHGLCLPMALSLETVVRASTRADQRLTIVSDGYDDHWSLTWADLHPGAVRGWPAYAAGVAWAMSEVAQRDAVARWQHGIHLAISSSVPSGAGLSSSAAVECAVAVALQDLGASDLSPEAMVTACIRAETEMAGAPTGGMDQTISMFAPDSGALLLDFADDRSVHRTPVPLSLLEQDFSLLIVDTRVSHALDDGGYADRRDACRRASTALGVASLRDAALDAVEGLADPTLRKRARHVVTENQRVLDAVDALQAADAHRLGALFVESHHSMRDDFEISTPELDATVETALASGAIGARMTGGGFGGSAIALIPRESLQSVADAVGRRFAAEGWLAPSIIDARPGRAASTESP